MREEHGNPDVVEVRRIFPIKEKAILWESKVIQRMGAVKDARFINRANQGKVFHTIGNLSEEHRQSISIRMRQERSPNFGKRIPEELIEKRVKNSKKQYQSVNIGTKVECIQMNTNKECQSYLKGLGK